ncbi:Protein-disulfide isomerase [Devosia lucknowensis]|uniref:Protein-disulfide isomerase n=1 Tax=Devosia lucknowensis TaxID=1096929 RepID=A0A1Y6EGS6_9HYPH|nr:DsbA family protein [Devosia lucknowensis]SMQ59792.1 Protein-disulfide isomerase [Devosia lucknowensis]
MTTNRRNFIIAGAAVAVATVGGGSFLLAPTPVFAATAQPDQPVMPLVDGMVDKVEGSMDAPVTLIEYASPTCPHCAAFHTTVYPQLKADYIETGKVKFIVRPFLRNEVDAAIFMLAEAAGPERYEEVLSTYFSTQNNWMSAPGTQILAIAQQLGFTQESFNAALTNQELLQAMEAVRTQAMDDFGVTGTPSFYVNGNKITTGYDFEQLAAAIDPLVPADFVPTAPSSTAPAAAPAADAMAPANDATSPVDSMAPANEVSPAN